MRPERSLAPPLADRRRKLKVRAARQRTGEMNSGGVSDPAPQLFGPLRAGSLTPIAGVLRPEWKRPGSGAPPCPDACTGQCPYRDPRLRSRTAHCSVSVTTAHGLSYRVHRTMVVLRCTHRLLARLKRADRPLRRRSPRRGSATGTATSFNSGDRQHLLFVSERTRLPVVIPIREARHLATVFPDTVCDRSWPSSASPTGTSRTSARGCRRWPSAGPRTVACLGP